MNGYKTEGGGYRFTVKVGKPKDDGAAKRGTKSGSSGSSFLCLMSGTPMPFEYLRTEAKIGRMGARMMAIVAEGERGRVFLSPSPEMESIAKRTAAGSARNRSSQESTWLSHSGIRDDTVA